MVDVGRITSPQQDGQSTAYNTAQDAQDMHPHPCRQENHTQIQASDPFRRAPKTTRREVGIVKVVSRRENASVK